ncbi:MAG: heparin lyase I family protein [Deltaproteobacteria bacterium]|nr:heparin lyase I family protein [Deltaproteobacteria bacterium]
MASDTHRSRWARAGLVLGLGLGLLSPSRAGAEVLWRGDFETGDTSQWDSAQSMGPDRLRVVTSPVRQGTYALRVEVRQGDDPINASGNRNELVKHDNAAEGRELYYGWSTLWPSDYPLTPTWQVFTQWHHPGNSGAPPVRFVLGCSAGDCGAPLTDQLFFIVNGGDNVWTHRPLTRGQWHDFILHIKWSADPASGFVELWYDGEVVLPLTHVRTLFSSTDVNYLKLGLYRDAATQPTAVLYHDGMVQATTLAEAQPAGPPPDAGVSDATAPFDGAAPPGSDAGPRPDAGAPDGEAAPDGGPPPTRDGPAADGEGTDSADVDGVTGCACRAAGGATAGPLLLLAGLLLWSALRGRRAPPAVLTPPPGCARRGRG